MAKGKVRPMNFHNHKVRIGDAGIKGRGVFARCAIAEREAIEVAPSLMIPRRDLAHIQATFLNDYIFGHHDDAYDLIALGFVSIYNHSFTPNARFVLTERAVMVMALSNIAVDEEISFDYGWSDASFKASGILPP